MLLCQCVVTLRVWHLFVSRRFIRWLAVTVFIFCSAGTVIVAGDRFNDIEGAIYELSEPSTTDTLKYPSFVFVMYLPALVVHTTMLFLTMYRFRISPPQQRGIIHRLVKEGIIMYAFAAGTLLYEIVSLSMTEPQDVSIYYSALVGDIAVATTVVSVCRAMLSVRSLAATYHVDPAWLLNHAELSRVQWKRGATEGEIVVEVNEMGVFFPSRSLALPTWTIGGEGDLKKSADVQKLI
ncbi:uncharacterized protein EDB91DRAFT_227096 [Suillus paluster]|uniref:uncharacterized protein n=1 Tax=Suillus paluster TaxID=48578 RepID=UPI001B87EFC7|nr:uncharacterized protein EDB91DRAFT_227096 [Suillus paluster]KAG1722032.1 hypothetical protein EDB91DRAFT_227096 [Suillus paluster]